MSTIVEITADTAARVSVLMSALALLLAGVTFVSSLDDGQRERETDARLACLELPGPNDCGVDGD